MSSISINKDVYLHFDNDERENLENTYKILKDLKIFQNMQEFFLNKNRIHLEKYYMIDNCDYKDKIEKLKESLKETWLYKFMIKLLDWLSKKLRN